MHYIDNHDIDSTREREREREREKNFAKQKLIECSVNNFVIITIKIIIQTFSNFLFIHLFIV